MGGGTTDGGFRVGDVVRLKGGWVNMTVIGVGPTETCIEGVSVPEGSVVVVWIGNKDTGMQAVMLPADAVETAR